MLLLPMQIDTFVNVLYIEQIFFDILFESETVQETVSHKQHTPIRIFRLTKKETISKKRNRK